MASTRQQKTDDRFFFDRQYHEFGRRDDGIVADPTADRLGACPLSVIVQVTRRCSLHCHFCSESEQFPDPLFSELEELKPRLAGVQRVYLSGGEPLLRSDIFEVLRSYRETFPIVGLPTNGIGITDEVARKLLPLVSYANVGLDGPRAINNLVRGEYDGILSGLHYLRACGVEVSLSTVVLKETLPFLEHVVQTADTLAVKKVKFAVPVSRGRAKSLTPDQLAGPEEIVEKFRYLQP